MDENVPAFFGQPILIRTSTMYVKWIEWNHFRKFMALTWIFVCDRNGKADECTNKNNLTDKPLFWFCSCFSYRFTQIVVDAQIKTPGGKTYDVIFVGTGKWKINMFNHTISARFIFAHAYVYYIRINLLSIAVFSGNCDKNQKLTKCFTHSIQTNKTNDDQKKVKSNFFHSVQGNF